MTRPCRGPRHSRRLAARPKRLVPASLPTNPTLPAGKVAARSVPRPSSGDLLGPNPRRAGQMNLPQARPRGSVQVAVRVDQAGRHRRPFGLVDDVRVFGPRNRSASATSIPTEDDLVRRGSATASALGWAGSPVQILPGRDDQVCAGPSALRASGPGPAVWHGELALPSIDRDLAVDEEVLGQAGRGASSGRRRWRRRGKFWPDRRRGDRRTPRGGSCRDLARPRISKRAGPMTERIACFEGDDASSSRA